MSIHEDTKKRAKIVSKAWSDPAFKKRLLENPAETLKAEGIDLGKAKVHAHEESDQAIHFVLPKAPNWREADLKNHEHVAAMLCTTCLFC